MCLFLCFFAYLPISLDLPLFLSLSPLLFLRVWASRLILKDKICHTHIWNFYLLMNLLLSLNLSSQENDSNVSNSNDSDHIFQHARVRSRWGPPGAVSSTEKYGSRQLLATFSLLVIAPVMRQYLTCRWCHASRKEIEWWWTEAIPSKAQHKTLFFFKKKGQKS